MSHIKSVAPKDDYRLDVLLDNGSSVTLNLESRLQTIRFGMLADRAFFERATTDGNYIRWDNMIEISVSELFQLAQK
jgi:DNA polymerase III delta prime subunit